jgi:DNA polymerase III alpha subunit
MPVEKLVQKAVEAKADAIALTDINNSSAVPEFAAECIRNNIRPVAGIEFRNGNELQYIGIARNSMGFRELNEFLSQLNFGNHPVPFPAPQFMHSYVIYPLNKQPGRKLFDNERIGIRSSEMNRLITLTADRKMMVLLQPVTFAAAEDISIHKSLRAVDNNILLSHLKPSQCAAEDEFFFTSPSSINGPDSHVILENTRRLMDDCTLDFD